MKKAILFSMVTGCGFAYAQDQILEGQILQDQITQEIEFAPVSDRHLTEIVIPTGVTTIKKEAFARCPLLASVVIPDTVTTIEDGAFIGCRSLKTIDLPSSIRTIGDFAFALTSLATLALPETVQSVGRGAFWGCRKLSEATIYGNPDLGDYSFYECHRLADINVCNEAAQDRYQQRDNLFTRRALKFHQIANDEEDLS